MAIFYDEDDFLESDLIGDDEDDEEQEDIEDLEESLDNEEELPSNDAFLYEKDLDDDLSKLIESKRKTYKFIFNNNEYKGKVLKKLDDSSYIFEVIDKNKNKSLKKIDIRYAIQK